MHFYLNATDCEIHLFLQLSGIPLWRGYHTINRRGQHPSSFVWGVTPRCAPSPLPDVLSQCAYVFSKFICFYACGAVPSCDISGSSGSRATYREGPNMPTRHLAHLSHLTWPSRHLQKIEMMVSILRYLGFEPSSADINPFHSNVQLTEVALSLEILPEEGPLPRSTHSPAPSLKSPAGFEISQA